MTSLWTNLHTFAKQRGQQSINTIAPPKSLKCYVSRESSLRRVLSQRKPIAVEQSLNDIEFDSADFAER